MHKDKANVGDVVRSYDFKPIEDRGDCYIEGIVIEKSDYTYKIAVQNRVFDGKTEAPAVGEYVITHFEQHFMEWEGRISRLVDPSDVEGVAA